MNYQQDNWTSQLPLAEFIYNNTPHSATSVSLFFANKGYHPRLTISLEGIPMHKAHMVATDLETLHQHLRDQLKVAKEAYLCFADRKREDMPDWKVGTKVWLDLHNVKTKRPMKKLDSKHAGPFQILAKISTHTY